MKSNMKLSTVLFEASNKQLQDKFKTLLSNKSLNLRREVIDEAVRIFGKLPTQKASEILKNFRKFSLDEFINGKYKIYSDFFRVTPQGFGAGELMCVMGIQNSRSGGLAEKDVIIGNEVFEVKEDLKGIRMAKDGRVGKLPFTSKVRQFYNKLGQLGIFDMSKEDMLELLKQIFTEVKTAEQLVDILYEHFIGPDQSYRERINEMNEVPNSMIESIYQGFKKLHTIKSKIKQNKQSINKSKIQVNIGGDKTDILIPTDDANKIKKAKTNQDVTVNIGPKLTGNLKEILFDLFDVLKHEYVTSPKRLPADFRYIVEQYFADFTGMIGFEKGKPIPSLRTSKEFTIYTISSSQAKLRLASSATASFEKDQLIGL